MSSYVNKSSNELQNIYQQLEARYNDIKKQDLSLDLSRGKPSAEQLDLCSGMLNVLTPDDMVTATADVRNYGLLDGIPEMKKLWADILEVSPTEVFVGGNSSLHLIYDLITKAMLFGLPGGKGPWCKEEKVKFLCPAPGYDRHFKICEDLGIEMVTIPMGNEGPDMDLVEQYVNSDPTVKGIFCIPMYSNPTGITYSDEVVRRFAALTPAAGDFRIFWDEAYIVHHFDVDHPDHLLNLMTEAKKLGHEDMVTIFASTSKISYSGGGVAAFACSENNMAYLKRYIATQIISYDKVNQLRHYKFFKDLNGIMEHMRKQSAIIAPKFKMLSDALRSEIVENGIGSFHDANGGYFLTLYTLPGCAKRVFQLCKEAGLTLTDAGAPFPYGIDPNDEVLRLAPTYADTEHLKIAIQLLCLCVKLASIEKLLQK